jgi:hypothetical protein
MTVQLNRLSIGPRHLESAQLLPIHKSRIESSLSTYFLKQGEGNQQIPFRINLSQNPSPDLKEALRTTRYYQHMDILPRKPMSAADSALREKTARAAARAMGLKSVPGTSGQVIAGARIAEDGLSITRNALFATIGADNPIASHLGYYAGVMWNFFGIREMGGGRNDLKGAQNIGDSEGVRRAQARIASGAIVTSASTAYLAGKVFDTVGVATASIGAMVTANVLFGIGSVLAMVMSSLGWIRCHRFNERLNEYLENPHLSEVQNLRGALQFLKDTISVTQEEVAQLRADIDKKNPSLSPVEKKQLLHKKMTDLAEVKVKYLKRRTSNKSLQMIISQVDPLLAKLGSEQTRSVGIKEATLLLHKVQNENRVKMSLFILGFVAAAVSIVAMAVMTFMTAGALPFVLFGIAGVIYLSVGIYSAAGLFLRKDPSVAVDLQPIQDIVPLELHHS